MDRQELVRDGRRRETRGRKPTVKCLKMSGPLSRDQRKEESEKPRKENIDDINWENGGVRIGEKLDEDPEDTEPDSKWLFTREPVSKEEKKRMMGKILEVAIKATFQNHIYTYRNDLYYQQKGGAIGLRLTGIVARIVMDRWSRQFKETVLDLGIQLHMLEKYVDNVNLVLDIIAQGYGWV